MTAKRCFERYIELAEISFFFSSQHDQKRQLPRRYRHVQGLYIIKEICVIYHRQVDRCTCVDVPVDAVEKKNERM